VNNEKIVNIREAERLEHPYLRKLRKAMEAQDELESREEEEKAAIVVGGYALPMQLQLINAAWKDQRLKMQMEHHRTLKRISVKYARLKRELDRELEAMLDEVQKIENRAERLKAIGKVLFDYYVRLKHQVLIPELEDRFIADRVYYYNYYTGWANYKKAYWMTKAELYRKGILQEEARRRRRRRRYYRFRAPEEVLKKAKEAQKEDLEFPFLREARKETKQKDERIWAGIMRFEAQVDGLPTPPERLARAWEEYELRLSDWKMNMEEQIKSQYEQQKMQLDTWKQNQYRIEDQMKPPEQYEHKANMWYQYYTTYRAIKMALISRIYQLNRDYTLRYYNAFAEYKKSLAEHGALEEEKRAKQEPIIIQVEEAIDTEAKLVLTCASPVDITLEATWNGESTTVEIPERHSEHEVLLTGLWPYARVHVRAEGTDRRGMRHAGETTFVVSPSPLVVSIVSAEWIKGYAAIGMKVWFKCGMPMLDLGVTVTVDGKVMRYRVEFKIPEFPEPPKEYEMTLEIVPPVIPVCKIKKLAIQAAARDTTGAVHMGGTEITGEHLERILAPKPPKY